MKPLNFSGIVGHKQDYELNSLDFEEFLWAKGYSEAQIEDLYAHMLNLEPFSDLTAFSTLSPTFSPRFFADS